MTPKHVPLTAINKKVALPSTSTSSVIQLSNLLQPAMTQHPPSTTSVWSGVLRSQIRLLPMLVNGDVSFVLYHNDCQYNFINTILEDFRVVISGSNGYNKLALPNPAPGYQGPVALPGAINAPLDPVNNKDTYMGYKFFSFNDVQTFANGVIACTSACTKQTQYNAEHPPSTGKPAVCNQVVVYILNDNGSPQGIYCSMYTESWDPKYATNVGQYRGSDYWSVTSAFSFITDSYAAKYKPICALDGCPADSYKGGNNGGYGQDPVKTTPKCKSKRSKKAL